MKKNNIVDIYINTKSVAGSTSSEYSITVDDIQSDFFESVIDANNIVTQILNEQLTKILKEYIMTNKQFVVSNRNIKAINPSVILTYENEYGRDQIYIILNILTESISFIITY